MQNNRFNASYLYFSNKEHQTHVISCRKAAPLEIKNFEPGIRCMTRSLNTRTLFTAKCIF